jgi:hypothetical protein
MALNFSNRLLIEEDDRSSRYVSRALMNVQMRREQLRILAFKYFDVPEPFLLRPPFRVMSSSVSVVRVLAILLLYAVFATGEASAQTAPDPFFSHTSGFYHAPFDLQISSAGAGEVHFTLDGSEPTEVSPTVDGLIQIAERAGEPSSLASIETARDYFDAPTPATVPRATVVRARVITADGAMSPVVTHTYFVEDPVPVGELPVIALTVDSTGFFGYDEGLYVPGRIYDENYDESVWIGHRPANYNQRGVEWERDVFIQFFEPDGTLGFEQSAGARTHGGATRALRLKSLRLYARSAYDGDNSFDYPMLGDAANTGHRRMLLRNSGQDFQWTMFGDALQHEMVKHLNFETQGYRPAQVFLNGEYWGIHNIRERYDHHEFARRHGLHPDDIVILENNATVDVGHPGDELHYLEVRDFLRDNPVDSTAMALVRDRIDLSSFIDYHVTQIFFNNQDWPGNNIRFWRARNGDPSASNPNSDGRWRYVFYDLDDGMRGNAAYDMLTHSTEAGNESWPNPDWSTLMLRRLLTNEDFRNEFIHRFSDLMNTAFMAVRVESMVDEISDRLRTVMPAHLDRWQPYQSMSTWESHVNSLRQFAWARPNHVREHMKGFFGIDAESRITVDVPFGDGRIKVNHQIIDHNTPGLRDPANPYPWPGYYFNDVPLTFTAVPDDHHRLLHWLIDGEVAGSSEELTLVLSADTEIAAVFEPVVVDAMLPEPHALANGSFTFDYWSSETPEGVFPAHMGFQQTEMDDPRLDDEMTGPYHIPHDEYASADSETIGQPYNNTVRTRINGLGDEGISFINTGRGRDLGAAVVALDTRGVDAAHMTWTGGTVLANSRVYHIRLQYRVGESGEFHNMTVGGHPVEYQRRNENGHSEVIGPIALPPDVLGQPYVQLRWKYYYTGERLNPNVGQRDELRLDNIIVEVGEAVSATRLVFATEMIGGQPGVQLTPISVYAVDDSGRVDATFTGDISITGKGAVELSGPSVLTAERGVATFNGLTADGPAGAFQLTATAASLESDLTTLRLVTVQELVMPAYIQGAQPDNDDRVPFAYRLRIEGLDTLATYRFGNRVVNADDAPEQDGSGNMLLRMPDGTFVRNTDSPRFRDADFGERHSTLITDEQGVFTGWFVTEASGNRRFMPGENVSMLVMLNDGQSGEEAAFYLRTPSEVKVLPFSMEEDGGTGLYASSHQPPGSVMVLFDGDQRVIGAAPVETLGFEIDDRFAGFYVAQVHDCAGNAGMIVPNDLTDGIVSVEWMPWTPGPVLASATAEQAWFGAIDTRWLNGGVRNPISLVFREDVPAPALPQQFAIDTSTEPQLTWDHAPQGGPYVVEIALFSDFVAPLHISDPISDSTWTPPQLDEYTRYVWRVGRTEGDGFVWSQTATFETGSAVGGELPTLPSDYSMHPPYPNPFAHTATFVFELPIEGHVHISAYDVLGRRVAVLADGHRPAGRHEVSLLAGALPSGTYLVRMETGASVITRPVTILR